MLKTAAEYPHPGSFALFIDTTLPTSLQRAELVRILERSYPSGSRATVSFPLRDGASGLKTVPVADLIDATALDAAERKEHAELAAHLSGRENDRVTRTLKHKLLRSESLRKRAIWSVILESELAKLRSLDAREQASGGQRLPREIAA